MEASLLVKSWVCLCASSSEIDSVDFRLSVQTFHSAVKETGPLLHACVCVREWDHPEVHGKLPAFLCPLCKNLACADCLIARGPRGLPGCRVPVDAAAVSALNMFTASTASARPTCSNHRLALLQNETFTVYYTSRGICTFRVGIIPGCHDDAFTRLKTNQWFSSQAMTKNFKLHSWKSCRDYGQKVKITNPEGVGGVGKPNPCGIERGTMHTTWAKHKLNCNAPQQGCVYILSVRQRRRPQHAYTLRVRGNTPCVARSSRFPLLDALTF